MDAKWVKLHGLEDAPPQYNGMVGQNLGLRHGGLVCVALESGESVLVEPGSYVPQTWVAPPETMQLDMKSLKTVAVTKRPRYLQFYDAELLDIVLQGFEGQGYARYAVGGKWRPNFTSAEITMRDVDGVQMRCLRMDMGSLFRRIPLPKEEGALTDRLRSFFKFCGVPTNVTNYTSGDVVTFTRPLHFTEGEGVPVGTPARVLDSIDDDVEVLLASGDRFDVPKVDLALRPPLAKDQAAVLLREVNFQSGKSVEEFSLVDVVKAAETSGMYEVRHDSTVFDVNGWWLRIEEGPVLS